MTFLASKSIVLYVWKVLELLEVFVSVGMHVCVHVCMCVMSVCVCVCVYTDAYSGYTHTVGTYCTLYSISVLCTVSVFGIIISAKKRKTESFF